MFKSKSFLFLGVFFLGIGLLSVVLYGVCGKGYFRRMGTTLSPAPQVLIEAKTPQSDSPLLEAGPSDEETAPVRIAAFIRFKDEMKTLPAMLASIEEVFDKIVMIHSNERDDGSISYARDWCKQRPFCEIHMYPHFVVPSHDARYQRGQVHLKNSLAAYYDFGLQFFNPEEYVVKIDADQVYLTKTLQKAMAYVRTQEASIETPTVYSLNGYNTFVWHNNLVLFRSRPFNGGGDSFVVKRKYIKTFLQTQFYEKIKYASDMAYEKLPGLCWFHFSKAARSQGTITALEDIPVEKTETLPLPVQALFNREIRPLLEKTNSPYKDVSF